MPTVAELYDGRTMPRRILRVWAIAFVVATIIIFGTAMQSYMELTLRGETEIPLFRLIRWRSIWWYGWAIITPLVFEFVWRRPLTRENWPLTLAQLVGGGIVAYALHVSIQVATMYLPTYSMVHETFLDAVRYHIVISLYLNVFIYWVIVGVANGLRAYSSAQARALSAANLEAQLANARLDALKMQLHPHFLFNTLHGISTLMYRDVDAADAMVNRLSRLLRKALDRSDVHEVTVREEIEFLEEYLAIERIRFGDDLAVRFEVPDEVDSFLVPSFVLQPLVENSIKYAIAPGDNKGTIAIAVTRYDDVLRLSVTDDGPGIPKNEDAIGVGVGLSNLHDRLVRMYGARGELHLENLPDGGLRVTVAIPARHSSQAKGT